jgi:hypothetical protein
MYVNPFIFGVLCTIGVEIVGLFAYALYEANRRGKK